MKTVIVYSSATGNTARLAQELSAQLNLPAMPLAEAEGWQDADRILAGFWTDKGSCDEKMAAFLSGLGGKEIALFGTAGFGKEDAYFEAILGRVKEHLPADCRYLAVSCARARWEWASAAGMRPCWRPIPKTAGQKCCWKTSMLSWTVRTIRIWKH